MNRTKFLLILLLLAIASAFVSYQINQRDHAPGQIHKDHEPDYYMENSTTFTMNPDGSAKNKLTAAYLVHYPDNDTTELTRPRLELFKPDKPPTVITAEKGWITSNNEVILLSGIVKLRQDNNNGDLELQVDTSDVKILLYEDYAETDQHAVITGKRSRTETDGLKIYMNQQRVELLNNVKGKILPKR